MRKIAYCPTEKICFKCHKKYMGNVYGSSSECPKCRRKWIRTRTICNAIYDFITGYK